MTTAAPAVWHIWAGPAPRSYGDIFLRHGVALLGSGDAGPWKPEREDADFEGVFVRRFATEPRIGDAMLLRTGLSRIRAVGLVASEYLHVEAFDDVNGYDLQHTRRVRWSELPAEYDFAEPVFGAHPPRFSGVQDERVRDYVRRFLNSPPTHWQDGALPSLSDEEPPLQDVPERLRGVVGEAQDLHRIVWDREAFGAHPSEDEMVAHLVIPLLRALGWPPERIAVKWRHVDIALFHALPRRPDHCRLVVEVKRLGGVSKAHWSRRRGMHAIWARRAMSSSRTGSAIECTALRKTSRRLPTRTSPGSSARQAGCSRDWRGRRRMSVGSRRKVAPLPKEVREGRNL